MAKKVDNEDIQTVRSHSFINTLVHTVRSEDSMAIAAIQMGESIHLFLMEFHNNDRYANKDFFPLTIVINLTNEAFSKVQFCNWE
ncbi:MAG: peptide deformylase [Algoriphagus sp.]|jgi:peptide deformylase